MNAQQLTQLRKTMGATMEQFAAFMGVPVRTLENIEGEKVALRDIHENAAEFAALNIAITFGRYEALPDRLKNLAGQIGEMVEKHKSAR